MTRKPTFRVMSLFRHLPLALVIVGTVPWTPAAAQSIRGRAMAADDGRPLSDVLIILEDSLGQESARVGTLSSGTFAFHFVSPGRHRLRVLRIGHAPWRSPEFTVTAGVVDMDLSLPLERLPLPDDIVVEGSGACRSDPVSGSATALLMEEAQKAFALAEETLAGGQRRFRSRTYVRTVDPEGRVVEEEAAGEELSDWPIRSAPVDTLIRWGFVRPPSRFQEAIGLGPTYFGPDGTVLFSDWFLGAHCFRLTRETTRPGQVGLAFEPAARQSHPGIAGTLWIDQASLALERLEFVFVNLPSWVPEESAGGELRFAEVPGGGWVVQRWSMRAPIGGAADRGGVALAGFQERGGRVVEVVDRRGAHLHWMDGDP